MQPRRHPQLLIVCERYTQFHPRTLFFWDPFFPVQIQTPLFFFSRVGLSQLGATLSFMAASRFALNEEDSDSADEDSGSEASSELSDASSDEDSSGDEYRGPGELAEHSGR